MSSPALGNRSLRVFVLVLGALLVCSGLAQGAGAKKLKLTTVSPAAHATLAGSVTWSVRAAGAAPKRVTFAIDGRVVSARRSTPYKFAGRRGRLDTTRLGDGVHKLTATAFGPRGRKARTSIVVAVSNQELPGAATTTAKPTVPGHPATKSGGKQSPAPVTKPAPEPETTPLPESSPEPGPTGSGQPIYWGATIGSQLTGSQAPWDMNAVSSFEGLAGRPLSLVQFFQPFSNCASSPCSFYKFPKAPLENVRQHGAIPVLAWSSQSIPSSVNEPDYQLSDVIGGRYDSDIREFAVAAKNWGHPFFLRFNWEMNGSWFPWSERANGNKPGEYVKAWRHVHDIFTSVGATNATWTWCPNVDFNDDLQSLNSLYPGDEYVDWTGLDGYNWGTNPVKPSGWKSFDQIYSSTYQKIVSLDPSKPMMIGEIGSTESGGAKAEWIKNALRRIPSAYPKIRALLWFDKLDDGMDWPIESSSSASAAFAEGISSPAYVGNSFSSLSASAVSPVTG